MKRILASAGLVLAAGCATTPVDLKEPRRLVGTENQVRLDVQITGETLSSSVRIPLKYDITNERSQTIAIADLVPEVTYDPDTQTVTINVGSEVPGNEFLPRLITIPPGEKRSFDTVARVNLVVNPAVTPFSRFPNALRVKLNFLGDTSAFEPLIGIPERAVHNPQLADDLFPVWLERNETVYTNTVPMRWSAAPEIQTGPMRRRRRS